LKIELDLEFLNLLKGQVFIKTTIWSFFYAKIYQLVYLIKKIDLESLDRLFFRKFTLLGRKTL
jgi:hypothetical protein